MSMVDLLAPAAPTSAATPRPTADDPGPARAEYERVAASVAARRAHIDDAASSRDERDLATPDAAEADDTDTEAAVVAGVAEIESTETPVAGDVPVSTQLPVQVAVVAAPLPAGPGVAPSVEPTAPVEPATSGAVSAGPTTTSAAPPVPVGTGMVATDGLAPAVDPPVVDDGAAVPATAGEPLADPDATAGGLAAPELTTGPAPADDPAVAAPATAARPGSATAPAVAAEAPPAPPIGPGAATGTPGLVSETGLVPDPDPWEQLATVVRPLRTAPDGSHRLALQLRPAELGTVHLEVAVTDGRLSVRAVADSVVSRDLIAAALPELRAELTGAGIDLGDLDVGARTTGGSSEDRGEARANTPQVTAGRAADPAVTGGSDAAVSRPSSTSTGAGHLDLAL